jgi:hypothetical protein
MDFFDVYQAAKFLSLSHQRVRQFCGEGRLGTKVGQQWVITREELEAFSKTDRPSGRPPVADEESDDGAR